MTGTVIKIDSNGDSEGNFTLLASKHIPFAERDQLLTEEEKKGNYSCEYIMRPIARFQYGDETPVSLFVASRMLYTMRDLYM